MLIACSWLLRSLGGLGQTPGKSWEPQNREFAVDIDPRGHQQTESGQVATSTPLRQDMENGRKTEGENSNQDLEVWGSELKPGDGCYLLF